MCCTACTIETLPQWPKIQIYLHLTYQSTLFFQPKHVLVLLAPVKEKTQNSSSLLCLSHFLFIIKVSQRTLALQCPISIFTHKESLLMLCSVWRNHCIPFIMVSLFPHRVGLLSNSECGLMSARPFTVASILSDLFWHQWSHTITSI